MVSRATDKSKREHIKQFLPFVPTPEFMGDLGTRQPDKIGIGKMLLQSRDCVMCPDCSKRGLNIRNENARMNNQLAALTGALVNARKTDFGFEGITGSNKPPYRIKPEIFHRDFGIMNMSGMRGIKGTAQKTDPFFFPAGPIKKMRRC